MLNCRNYGSVLSFFVVDVVPTRHLNYFSLGVPYCCQNIHWKLGQQTPSVGTLLAYLGTMAWITFFVFQNRKLFENKIVKPHKISTQSDNG